MNDALARLSLLSRGSLLPPVFSRLPAFPSPENYVLTLSG